MKLFQRLPLILLLLTFFNGSSRLPAFTEQTLPRAVAPPAIFSGTRVAADPDQQRASPLNTVSYAPCTGGQATIYPCSGVDLLSFLPLDTFDAQSMNDSWGWTDPLDGREIAIMGLNNGTAFVDISDPVNPVYLGKLPTQTFPSLWRDIKVYADHAFIVSEANEHGMQIFDLRTLRTVPDPPTTFTTTAHYDGFRQAHNIVINEASGYAYAVGGDTCAGGLHMIDISDPNNPVGAGCYSSDGFTHDAQCVFYHGPDAAFSGHEICFNANVDALTIVDVTDKVNPQLLSRTSYDGSNYAHQGWLTEDHAYFLLGDEGDEEAFGHNTVTRIWDVGDLTAPWISGIYTATTPAIDHNLYVAGNYLYEANYRSGLRILDLSDIASGNLTEAAFFDIYPQDDDAQFDGAWNVYPFYDSGVVTISGIEEGLFVVRPLLPTQTSWRAFLPFAPRAK